MELFTPEIIDEKLKLDKWSVYYTALNQSLSAAATVLETDHCEKSLGDLLNELSNKNILNASEKNKITTKKLLYCKTVGVMELLEILQSKVKVDGRGEHDINRFINVLRLHNMISLANFIEEMIEKVKRVKNGIDFPVKSTTEKLRTLSK